MEARARADGRHPRRASARAAGTGRCSSGFAAETAARPRARAREARRKQVDLLVFNDVSRADIGFDATDNEVVLVSAQTASAAWQGAEGARSPPLSSTRWRTLRLMEEPTSLARALGATSIRRAIAENLERVIHAPARDAAARASSASSRGPPDHRGLPGRREDDAREGARPLGRLLASRASSSRPTCSRPTSPASTSSTSARTSSSSGRARSSRTSCSSTRSTAPRRRRRRRCSSACRSTRSRSTASRTRSSRPFMVIATQNPIEYEGTYPLPEAQLDRFTMRVAIGYPPLAEEARMLVEQTSEPPLDALEPVATRDRGARARSRRRARVYVEESLNRYVVAAAAADARATRASTSARARAPGIALLRVAKARALADGPRLRRSRRRQGGRGARARAPADPRARGALGRPRRAPRSSARSLERTPVPV